MRTTERKHWRDGYTVHGGTFHQFALSLFGYGVLVVIKGLNHALATANASLFFAWYDH